MLVSSTKSDVEDVDSKLDEAEDDDDDDDDEVEAESDDAEAC